MDTKMIGRLGVDLAQGSFLGDTRIRLLEAIAEHGAISRAARSIPLSYKAAWDAVDAMNNLAEQPLVVRAVGGRNGGGAQLTPYGRRLVALYRAMENETQLALDRLSRSLADADADPQTLQRMLRGMRVTPSARNQFAGPVTSLRAGEVTYEVGLRIDETNEIVAQVSSECVEQMRLELGRELHAWVNSSAVILMTDDTLRVSARNQLWGEVARVHVGPVSVEVVLALPSGRSLSALITRESLQELDLRDGMRACAVFKAGSVMLCAFD
ncbi:MAG: TOBE domain-containing protein [Candidatus Dactylopiibacterium sp.]|nr:TOBE domain-containing protein [Candidatus Dactylopiibacterium sp.]